MKTFALCSSLLLLMMTGMAQAEFVTVGEATYNTNMYSLIWDSETDMVWLDYANDAANWTVQSAWASNITLSNITYYEGYTIEWNADDDWGLGTQKELYSLASQNKTEDILTCLSTSGEKRYWTNDYAGRNASKKDLYYWVKVATAETGTRIYNQNGRGLTGRTATVTASAAPVPGTIVLFGAGLTSLAALKGRKKRTDDHSCSQKIKPGRRFS